MSMARFRLRTVLHRHRGYLDKAVEYGRQGKKLLIV